MDDEQPVLTVEQIRMAKAALGWSNPTLAEKTGLHRNTLNRAENGTATRGTLETLRAEFEKAGVTFIPKNGGPAGVRFQEPQASSS
ncbi:helix-turn-helix domain-containing protein [Aureimonas psammosilenae]|uniref:helix-turn-helix domain-containing protein n=1 Tax=Aureimonas psammosilenae TaxID=2495496 RepID=UPI001F33075D|nr:helix-turn-helix transcriptional regulator [Aureimonas psammosilenae]